MSAVHHTHAAGAELGDNTVMRYGAIEHASSYAFPRLARKIPVADQHCWYWDGINSALITLKLDLLTGGSGFPRS